MARARRPGGDPVTVVAAIPRDLQYPTPGCGCVHCAGESGCSVEPTAECRQRRADKYAWLADRGLSWLDYFRAKRILREADQ